MTGERLIGPMFHRDGGYASTSIGKEAFVMNTTRNCPRTTWCPAVRILLPGCAIGNLLLACAMAFAGTAPHLREEISLNGTWERGGTVPNYQGDKFDRRTYQRRVAVPADWAGKQIELEFRQVNYAARVYVDGRLVGSHVGGWVPFAVDITPHVKAGSEFALRVEVTSSTQPPYVDAQGKPLWPVGTYDHDGSFAGIVDDVWLRAYGPVAIHDAFIRTSHREEAIAIDYTLTNHDRTARTVRVLATAMPWRFANVAGGWQTEPITLQAGETRVITMRKPWREAVRWFPDQPYLYQLHSRVMDGDKVLDQEFCRFGFREIWIEGNQYMLNGIRVNLWGDSLPRSWTDKSRITPQAWPATVDMLKNQLNVRILRWHQFPAADYLLDAADEKGLMIIGESALYARPWTQANQDDGNRQHAEELDSGVDPRAAQPPLDRALECRERGLQVRWRASSRNSFSRFPIPFARATPRGRSSTMATKT